LEPEQFTHTFQDFCTRPVVVVERQAEAFPELRPVSNIGITKLIECLIDVPPGLAAVLSINGGIAPINTALATRFVACIDHDLAHHVAGAPRDLPELADVDYCFSACATMRIGDFKAGYGQPARISLLRLLYSVCNYSYRLTFGSRLSLLADRTFYSYRNESSVIARKGKRCRPNSVLALRRCQAKSSRLTREEALSNAHKIPHFSCTS